MKVAVGTPQPEVTVPRSTTLRPDFGWGVFSLYVYTMFKRINTLY